MMSKISKIIFVNGKIGGGSPPKGAPYWGGENSLFVKKAIQYFDTDSVYFTDQDYGYLSSADKRRKNGYIYAKHNLKKIIESVNPNNLHFKIITHSMGTAYGEGIIDFLKLNSYVVDQVFHLNPFQAADIESNKNEVNGISTHVIDFQNTNDILIKNPFRSSPGDIRNADKKIRIKSSLGWLYVHRSPITHPEDFWSLMKQL